MKKNDECNLKIEFKIHSNLPNIFNYFPFLVIYYLKCSVSLSPISKFLIILQNSS